MRRPASIVGFLWVETGEMLADNLIGLVSFQTFCTGIPGNDKSRWVQPENGVIRRPVDQQPKLLGFQLGPLLLLEELDELPDLGLDGERQERLHQEVHRAKCVPFLQLGAVDVRGSQEDNRRMSGAMLATDQRGRVEAAQTGHPHIEKDNGKIVDLHSLDSLGTGADFNNVLTQSFKERPKCKEIGRLVIHEQDVRLVGGFLLVIMRCHVLPVPNSWSGWLCPFRGDSPSRTGHIAAQFCKSPRNDNGHLQQGSVYDRRPEWSRAKGRLGPVESADTLRHLSAAGEEGKGIVNGCRLGYAAHPAGSFLLRTRGGRSARAASCAKSSSRASRT